MKQWEVDQMSCKKAGYQYVEDGATLCGLNHDRLCNSEECPSHNQGDRRVGYHAMRALEQVGLTEEWEEEMGE